MEIKFFSDLTDKEVNYIAESNYNYWKNIAMKKNKDKLPIGIALIDKNKIAGFCTLRENRLKNHLDINPWLCNVMIFDEFKGKGYAKKMIIFACKRFKSFGYDKVYSWTDQVPEFYKKLGWTYEGKVTKNEGGEGLLFSKEI